MKQQYRSGAVADIPSSADAPSVGNPTEGDPGGAVPATVPGQHWFYMISVELVNVLVEAGIEPDIATYTQVRDAIKKIAAARKTGGLLGPVDAESADFAVTAGDDGKTFEVDASGGAKTGSLPALGAADDGFTVTVIKTDASANAVTVSGDGTDTINGAADWKLKDPYEAVILKWTGTAWLAIALSRPRPQTPPELAAIPQAGLPISYAAGNPPVGTLVNLSDDADDYKFWEITASTRNLGAGAQPRTYFSTLVRRTDLQAAVQTEQATGSIYLNTGHAGHSLALWRPSPNALRIWARGAGPADAPRLQAVHAR